MLAIATLLVACDPFVASRPETIVEPEVSGLVTDATLVNGSQTSYRLAVGGQEITIDTQDTEKLYDGFPEGGVVLYGTDPRPWYVGTPPPHEDCYLVSADRAFDDPDAVILVFSELGGVGIRVPKAPGFDPGPELSHRGEDAGQYISLQAPTFCLDAQGRMTRSTGASPPSTTSP
jgi:hypothetical protein